jgi:hypothetical protein
MVCGRVTSRREIIVSCMLIVIGAALIAVACRLVVIRPGLVLITCRLVAIRRQVILVTRRVVTAHVAIRALFCLPLKRFARGGANCIRGFGGRPPFCKRLVGRRQRRRLGWFPSTAAVISRSEYPSRTIDSIMIR